MTDRMSLHSPLFAAAIRLRNTLLHTTSLAAISAAYANTAATKGGRSPSSVGPASAGKVADLGVMGEAKGMHPSLDAETEVTTTHRDRVRGWL